MGRVGPPKGPTGFAFIEMANEEARKFSPSLCWVFAGPSTLQEN